LLSEVGNRDRRLEAQLSFVFAGRVHFRLPCSKRPQRVVAVLEVVDGAAHPVHAEHNSYLLNLEERSPLEHSHPNMDPILRLPDKMSPGKNTPEEGVAVLREDLDSDEGVGGEEKIWQWYGSGGTRLLMMDRCQLHARRWIF
jgi:anti-sigma factor ChrR (cupin superfamily)